MGTILAFVFIVACMAAISWCIEFARDIGQRFGWFAEPQWKREAEFLARAIPRGRY